MRTYKETVAALPKREVDYASLDAQIAWAEYEVHLNSTTPGSSICKWDFILDSLNQYKELRKIHTGLLEANV